MNVLLVTIDTLRSDAIGSFGAPFARTVSIDGLAAEGVLFSSAQTAVPITLPAHTTLFTGLYPASHGVRHNGRFLSGELETIAEQLSAEGYQTAAFIGSLVLSRAYRIAQGFEVYDDTWGGSADSEVGLHGIPERPAGSVAASFQRWFVAREPERPFFAWVHLYDPHAPYTPPPPLQEVVTGPYGGEVLYSDRQVGRLIDLLETAGLTDETVVILLSDHGEGLGEHDEQEHGLLLYETTLAIPWIIRAPGNPAGVIVQAPTHIVDFRPTLCEILGLPVDDDWPGESLLPLMRGERGDPERPLYAETHYGTIGYNWEPLYSIRSGPWKLVEGTYPELFHLDEDPWENHDRSRTDAGEANRLRRILARTREEQAVVEEEEETALTTSQKAALEALGYVSPRRHPEKKGRLDPRDVFPVHELIMKGRDEHLRGEQAAAESTFLRALAIDPENVDALLRLSDCYREMGRLADEESLYVRILSIDGDHAPAWCNLGVILERRGETDRAGECYDNAIRSDSAFALAYLNRGNILASRGDWDAAASSYRTAIRLSPVVAEAHYGLARAFSREDNLDSLVYHLKICLRLDPGMVKASNWLESLRAANTPGGTDDGLPGY